MSAIGKLTDSPTQAVDDPGEAAGAVPKVRQDMILGLLVLLVFFGGFGVWAAAAPLTSAVIAGGRVIVEGNRRTIQHLEGGIVEEILVRDGDTVAAGDVLVRLDPTQREAQLAQLQSRLYTLRVQEARLTSERENLDAIAFAPDLVEQGANNRSLQELIEGQSSIFLARQEFVGSQKEIHLERIAQLAEEIGGLEEVISSQDRRLVLITEEIGSVQQLYNQGLARKPRLLALQANAAEITGERGQNIALIARARRSISETELEVIDLENRLQNEIVRDLQSTQSEIDELRERLRGALDVNARTVITAPVSGTVVGLRVFTESGVIAPGAELMDIVPEGERLIVEARVNITDIDNVSAGQSANVRLVAFNQRTTAPIEGIVEQISADAFVDERTGASYYTARISLTDLTATIGNDLIVQPGMPAEVMIVTGARTTLEYLIEPISASVRRGISQN